MTAAEVLGLPPLIFIFCCFRSGFSSIIEEIHDLGRTEIPQSAGNLACNQSDLCKYKGDRFCCCATEDKHVFAVLYLENSFLLESGLLDAEEIAYCRRISKEMDETDATLALYQMSKFLSRYYGKKVIILLDEYDTPMQEAYMNGFWDEMASYMRNLFNAAFKTNPYLERGLMTGITRVSKESIFSDLNHLQVVTTTSDLYADSFGFTETEVFSAMDELGYDEKEAVKSWYDGFTFGHTTDIYNPWSILNYLSERKFAPYWANTSSNNLVGKLIREGSPKLKQAFEQLINGGSVTVPIDEQIVYSMLGTDRNAVFGLLLASGYVKVVAVDDTRMLQGVGVPQYELMLTNREVQVSFLSIVRGWFGGRTEEDYSEFVSALLNDDKKLMNIYMNRVTLQTISYFDSGNHPSENEPERFYHGLVLGLLVELYGRYVVTSNRESGFGRYDVMLEPMDNKDAAIILEFKVYDPQEEKSLEDTVASALQQIDEKRYAQTLSDHGIARDRIRTYGFAFEGKNVLIG